MVKIALLGRPNVGKSTLFNYFVGRKEALVYDMPGVTRDRKYGKGSLFDLEFDLVDTPGLDESLGEDLYEDMLRQSIRGAEEADIILFVADSREGVTALDHDLCGRLRRMGKPLFLLCNKGDLVVEDEARLLFYELGAGEPLFISSLHKQGFDDLYHQLLPFFPDLGDLDSFEGKGEEVEAKKAVRVAIVGRPNVGKSSFINQLIGEDRFLAGDIMGLTRESNSVDFKKGDQAYKIYDTAGLRKAARVDSKIEEFSTSDTLEAIQYAEVVLLIIDGTRGLEKQDLTIARHVINEGRCFVLALNKWDVLQDKNKVLEEIKYTLSTSLAQIKGVHVIPMSALTGYQTDKVFDEINACYKVWNKRIPTARLNEWLHGSLQENPPPLSSGRRLKIRYASQINTRPPTFAFFVNKIQDFPQSYFRYLTNSLRDTFGLFGVPIRILKRSGENPYAPKKGGGRLKNKGK